MRKKILKEGIVNRIGLVGFFGLIVLMLLSIVLGFMVQVDWVDEEVVKIQELFIDVSWEKFLGNYDEVISMLENILCKDCENVIVVFEMVCIYEV